MKRLKTLFFLALLACNILSAAPSLLDCLQTIDMETELDGRQTKLWEVHQGWIQTLLDFVKVQEEMQPIDYPEDTSHPIYFFDRKDAHDILKPIFQNVAGYNLTDEKIDRFFFDKCPPYRENGRSSSIDYFKKEEVKKETLRIAKIIYEYVQEDILIVLGQTPAYVGEMVKILNEKAGGQTTIVNVPFSGRPNYLCKLKYKSLWPWAFLDLVTPSGEKMFRAMLEKLMLSPDNAQITSKKLYILDNSSGASIACFLAFYTKWCEELGTQMPEFVFLEMCKSEDLEVINEEGQWIPAEKPDFRFDESQEFDLPVIFLGLQADILFQFDKLFDNLRIVPSFNGIHWSKEYFINECLLNYPTKEAKQLIEEYRSFESTFK